MVVSAHPDASRIGAQIIADGGNAVDAAVAVEFALAVCHPTAGNIGGGGFMVIRLNDGSLDAIDFREKAPGAASRDMYLDEKGEVVDGMSTNTHLASGVPGTVDGMVQAHARYGKLPWERVIQPAIDLAMNGFIVAGKQASSLNSMKRTFLRRNQGEVRFVREIPWREGDTLRQPELANTLMLIRDNGRAGFYEGVTADLVVREMQRGNGIITHEDLSNYKSQWRVPLTGKYRDEYTIISMAPPSSGGVALLQLLGMTGNHNLKEMGFMTAESIHLMAEAERRVYADRAEYLGDPDFYDVPVEALLKGEYLTGRMSDFNADSATPSSQISHGSIQMTESEETTHFSVVDTEGNAVSVTTTLNGGYGNGIVVEGAGFLLNNEMDDFSVKAGVPNMFGLVGGVANEITPGKRMLSSMTPTIVEKNGELFMVLGSPGGSTIITSVFQVIVNVIDFEMSISGAVDAGRFHHQWLPDYISHEKGVIDSILMAKLISKGHQLRDRESIGRVDAILVLPDKKLSGAADPRGDDRACGF
ncbi:MAG: gamma-glutamyltransferase [Bacteroidales bacterium]|nr:gamma-glutamyltransferase [Bacteroidales bacterium]